jgi:hypothetical protein
MSSHEIARRLLSMPDVQDVIIRGETLHQLAKEAEMEPGEWHPDFDLTVQDVKTRPAVLIEGEDQTPGDVVEVEVKSFVSGMIYL